MNRSSGWTASPAIPSNERWRNKHRIAPAFVPAAAFLAALLAPSLARAQCSNVASPSPPPAPAQTNYSNQSFGAPPLPPYYLNAGGQIGCDGASNGDFNGAGQDGFAGQPGGSFTSVNTGITVQGGSIPFVNALPTGAAWFADAGGGGDGGQGGYNSNGDATTGNGGAGGNGGTVTVQFVGSVRPDPSGNLPDLALGVQSNGGDGGGGADANAGGIQPKYGGDGGAGGQGGQASLTVSGNVGFSGYGLQAFAVGGAGGNGGDSPIPADALTEGHGGNGGAGGGGGAAMVVYQSGSLTGSGPFGQIFPIEADADGNTGGNGGTAYGGVGLFGGNGGNGGNGGAASVQLGAAAQVTFSDLMQAVGSNLQPGIGVIVTANGGAGGGGGYAGGDAQIRNGGGAGGNGGNGGAASATILGSINYTANLPAGQSSAAGFLGGEDVLVQANGGPAGNGAGAQGAIVGEGGNGGTAGTGGSASLTLGDATNTATLTANGAYTHGALVQSIGGGGGDGGSVSFVLSGVGGTGSTGGNGGPVTVTSDHAFVTVGSTSGEGSSPIIAQSIGGGGGSGGDASGIAAGAGFEIGGNSGRGGDGGVVQITLGQNSVFASLDPSGGAGILAQSIGGAGGNAGNATSTGAGLITLVIGGDAYGGGAGGQVMIDNGALVTTYGDHAAGIKAQSIGGGGGNGGDATAFLAGGPLASSVALGGRGGGGGPAGPVSLTNTGQISTYGPDAEGVLLQSIGGGGGSGGTATARSVAVSPSSNIPSVSVSVAIGGAGGAGNTGGAVTLNNSGLITTAGDSAVGVLAQSVGGGGGTGGDATAASYSASVEKGAALSVSVAIGGSGGSGGTGGDVDLTNSGLIATMGQDAYGVFAQSVGGGGGDGGTGDATASAADAKVSFSAAIAVGGSGGTGGTGGTVSLTNDGSIATLGDHADALFAQSVGGGGGAGGGGVGTAAGGKLAIAVGVGGSGGVGNTVTVTNNGGIVTRGTDSAGIFAQSVGGGGGTGGKGGATAGGVSTLSNAQAMFDILGQGLGLNQNVQNVGNGILQVGQIGEDIKASYDELNAIFSQPQSDPNSEEGAAVQINVGVSVGGSGGASGQGGAVNVTNTGQITTYGAQSYGIFAQSVGGGGGDGGAASSTGSASDDSQVQSAVAVGGRGGAAGSGGPVTVQTQAGSAIETEGVAAFGLYAQSVGGGGGNGALAGVVSGSLKSLSVGVGGNGGAAGDGGVVSVTSAGTITTLGKHSIGILAQSIGGGGGVVTTMTTDETFDPSKIVVNPQGRVADIHGLSLNLGGQNGSSGNGSSVFVQTTGAVATSGLDAHGIVAQSIGAGGGFVVGGQTTTLPYNVAGGGTGNGGQVSVFPVANVTTTGDGAFGVIAQSIGGGGGFAGDPSAVSLYQANDPYVMINNGNGGRVTIGVGGTIETTGRYAPAIFAQSIGGGGGVMMLDGVQNRGSAGGAGAGGDIGIGVGGNVLATGVGSAGILAQSDGQQGGGNINISVSTGALVAGGVTDPNNLSPPEDRDAAAIRLLGGASNTILNNGTIRTFGQYAILADAYTSGGGNAATTVTNSGAITGDIDLGANSVSVVNNLPGGVIDTPTTLNVGGGTVYNSGTLNVGGSNSVGTTLLTGNLVQNANGVLRVQIDPLNRLSDLLYITGTASLAGSVLVDPLSYLKGSSTVLMAAGGIEPGASLTGTSTPIFSFTPMVQGNSVAISTNADFQGAATGSATNQSVAAYLQRLWDSGNPAFESIFAPFGGIGSSASYAQALTSVSGQELLGVAAARYEASQFFARSAFSCPVFVDDSTVRAQDSCVWGRTTTMSDNRSADGSFPGFAWQGTTVKVGGQAQVEPDWFVGGALGYEFDNFTGNANLASASGNAVLGVLALKHQMGPWLFTGAVDGGIGWLNSARKVPLVGAVADASSDSFNVALHARAVYQIPLNRFYLEPALDGDLNNIYLPGYTESGAGAFDLKVKSANNVILTGTPNLRVGARLQGEGLGAIDAYVGGGVSFIAGDTYTTNASFVAAQGFGDFTNTLNNPHVAAKLYAGLELYTSDHLDIRLQYDGVFAAHQIENAGQIRLNYLF